MHEQRIGKTHLLNHHENGTNLIFRMVIRHKLDTGI